MRVPSLATAALLTVALTATAEEIGRDHTAEDDAPKNYLITFGDSYSKTGFQPELDQPSPSNPLGNPEVPGKTSAGGPNWIGYMVTEFINSWGPSNSSITLSYNFAASGGTVDKNLVRSTGHDFQEQVDQFKKYYGDGKHSWTADNAVAGAWFGVNDIRRSFSRINAGDVVVSIMHRYFDCLEQLYILGLRKFVLLSMPPLSMVPDMQKLHDRGISELNSAIELWNNLLQEKLDDFKSAHDDVVGQVVDTSVTFWAGVKDPDAFGARDTVCRNKDGQTCLWWDGCHPATKIERLVAAEVIKVLNSKEFQCRGDDCGRRHTDLKREKPRRGLSGGERPYGRR
ncbi:hypothetical protein BGZ63DRAFT_404913 [Mariannaea sp. PMI_226]|nr:hypothetical protein BGZ63DRAFT_404913 [Mariannaea sp. PMI_226]